MLGFKVLRPGTRLIILPTDIESDEPDLKKRPQKSDETSKPRRFFSSWKYVYDAEGGQLKRHLQKSKVALGSTAKTI
eukprot:gene7046-16768_t